MPGGADRRAVVKVFAKGGGVNSRLPLRLEKMYFFFFLPPPNEKLENK